MISFVFVCLLGFFGLTQEAAGWVDEGHLLIAAVAKLQLNSELVNRLESILSYWDFDYPGTGELQTAAVWLDHLSCRNPSPYCSGFAALDNVQVFRPWHYTTIVLNPQKVELKQLYNSFPIPQTGADSVLTTIYRSLMDTQEEETEETNKPNKQSSKKDNKIYNKTPRGSPFSLNLQLRLLLHIFGDVHQPLHTTSLFARGFPDGDDGGNWITLQGEGLTIHAEGHTEGIHSLHRLWDTAAGSFNKTAFELSWEEAKEMAEQIMSEFPKEDLKERLKGKLNGTNFTEIAKESAQIALNTVYSEFDWATFSRDSLPYRPTLSYIEKVKKTARSQIAVAGYRLAYLLQTMEHSLPVFDKLQQQRQQQQQQQQEWRMFGWSTFERFLKNGPIPGVYGGLSLLFSSILNSGDNKKETPEPQGGPQGGPPAKGEGGGKDKKEKGGKDKKGKSDKKGSAEALPSSEL